MDINWDDFITVNDKWIVEHLTKHTIILEDKITLRTYTIRLNGADYNTSNFISFVKDSIKNYVLTEREIAAVERNNGDAFDEAMQYFGKIDPTYDGKFGELILYLLVEAILKVPMIVFKIPLNPKDQVKGADGVFIGNYNSHPAILIGEAKTWGDLSRALDSAFQSLNRFHTPQGKDVLKYEYLVAKKGLRGNLSVEQLDYLYDCLTIGSASNLKRNMIHPVLIIYDDTRLDILKSETAKNAETKLNTLIEEKLQDHFINLKSLCWDYIEVSKVALDFFLIPMTSVHDFRKKLYYAIHGTIPIARKQNKRAPKKSKT